VAGYLSRWAIRRGEDHVLEPSCGDGAFLSVCRERLLRLGGSPQNLYGVEARPETFKRLAESYPDTNCLLTDFLDVSPFPVEAVIGNPPYIRLRNLAEPAAGRAVAVTEKQGVRMQKSGSLWMPFVVHAASFLKPGGRLALVLPFEMTYVKYALPLWQFLAGNFDAVIVARIHEDLFPDNEEEVFLLMADGFGRPTGHITYRLYQTKEDLLGEKPAKSVTISAGDILKGKRPFVKHLLDQDQISLLAGLEQNSLVAPVSRFCKFKTGYVSGDKKFFHPDRQTRSDFALPEHHLIKSVINSRQLKGLGLYADAGHIDSQLYYPACPEAGDRDYIRLGEATGISSRYKCKIRSPWYLTPGVTKPDLLLTVFTDQPLLLGNRGRYAASNSLLCGYLTGTGLSAEDILCRWYNSLTLLSVELQVHALGGGVLVLIPGEADSIRIPCAGGRVIPGQKEFLAEVNLLLRTSDAGRAYEAGDRYVLQEALGLDPGLVARLREAIGALRRWRKK
jgi:hypothetical protein